MTLTLRKVIGHPQAIDAYRVVYDGYEIGSIGKQVGNEMREFWRWGIESIVTVREFPTHGEAKSRDEAMTFFRAAWDQFAADPDRLSSFMEALQMSAEQLARPR